MNLAERSRIVRLLRAAGGRLLSSGRMLVAAPIERILRGLYLEDSSDPHRIYLWAFVQPLFVPSSSVVLNLGQRLGGTSRTWTAADVEGAASEVLNEGMEFFGPISSPAALACWSFLDARPDEYAREARAYALVACGQNLRGSQALRVFAASLPVSGPGWISEKRRRAEELARMAEADGEASQELLRQWEKETKCALRVGTLAS